MCEFINLLAEYSTVRLQILRVRPCCTFWTDKL